MQPEPPGGASPASRRHRPAVMRTLMALALGLTVLGCILTATSFALGYVALAANPTCVTPTGQLAVMLTELRLVWILSAATIVGALVMCSLIARHDAQMASDARATQVVGAIALAALALSFCGFGVASLGSCVA